MTSRDRFEEWYAEQDNARSGDSVRVTADFIRSMRRGDDYDVPAHTGLAVAWRCWQHLAPDAALGSLAVAELQGKTGVGPAKARQALAEAGGDVGAAERTLRLQDELARGYGGAGVVPGHVLYRQGDPDVPPSVMNHVGEVVLGLCRVCGRGEADLAEPCTRPVDGRPR